MKEVIGNVTLKERDEIKSLFGRKKRLNRFDENCRKGFFLI